MKNNILTYIFFIFIIIIVAFAVYKMNDKEQEQAKEGTVVVEEEEKIQELKVGAVQFDTINPILSNNKYVQDISKLVYEPLLNLTTSYELEPCLATEWAKTNETTYVIKLRQNVKWSDGGEFTAEDVRFTIDRIKETETIYAYNMQYVIEVEAVDKQTLKIVLSQEVPFFEYNLTFPILSRDYCSGEDFTNSTKVRNAVGTGAYKIDTRTDTYVTLEKNSLWWNKNNKSSSIDTIKILLYSNTGELYNDYKLGKLDIVNSTNVNIENYIGTIGYNKAESSGREYDYIAINTENAVLSNKEVRQAIMYAIDKNSIISNVYNGKYTIANYPLSYGSWLYQGNYDNTFNQEKATQVLVDNGWQYKYGNWQKNINYYTRRLNFKLVVNSSNEQRTRVAELIKEQLENVGIKVTLVKVQDNQYENYIENKNYDLIICGTYVAANPDLTRYFGDNNIANYNNEEAKQILNELKNITDKETLRNKFKRLEEIYLEDVPYISLYNSYNMLAYSDSITGNIQANWFNNFYNINTWNKK